MITRSLVFAWLLLLALAASADAGEYQRTSDGRAYVWNNVPKPGDTASWSGGTDSKRYATGYGTLTWYKGGAWVSRYSGTMMHGKLSGFVTNEDADGTMFQGTYINGSKSSDWTEVTRRTETPNATTVSQPETVELTAAVSAGYIGSAWTGMGNSGTMQLRVVNRTEREWLVQIEIGTKLEPSTGNAQSMVVTKEIEVHLHPHDSHTVEVEVNCLDISKPPPMPSDKNWSAQPSTRLAGFIVCVNRLIAAEVDKTPSDQAQNLRALQPLLLQVALWQARGATKNEWIEYFVHYWRMPRDKAQGMADIFEQFGGAVVSECPSI